jgi:hypothetical protein
MAIINFAAVYVGIPVQVFVFGSIWLLWSSLVTGPEG